MNRSKDTTRTANSIPLPIALLMCIIFALSAWTVIDLSSADKASAAAQPFDLSVGGVEIYQSGAYLDPALPAGITYNKDRNELTLENVTIASGEDYGGINYSGSKDLTIRIKGTVYFPYGENNNISYFANSDDHGNTISGANVRVVGDNKSTSKLIQKSGEFQYELFEIGSYDNEEDKFPMTVSSFTIENLSIQSTGGLDSAYSNVTINNCSWTMEGGDAPIRLRRDSGAGNLSVINSTIKMKAFKKSPEFPYAIYCNGLTLTGVNLYAGSSLSRLQTKLSPASSKCQWNAYAAYQFSPASQATLWRKLTLNGKLPTATKKHYKLAGWYTAKSGGTKITSAYKPSKGMTLYAHWKVAGKKKKVKLVKSLKCNGTTYKVSYYKNGMIKKIAGGGSKRTFEYDDQLRYAKVTLYQSHYSKKKPLQTVTFNYSTKKGTFKSNYLGGSSSVTFKVNKKGQFTYFNIRGLREKHSYKYNKRGHLISETEKEKGKLVLKTTYKRNSKGLIKSLNYWYKYDGKAKGRYKYSMRGGVPTRFSAVVSGYNDKATYRYSTKTVRDWQKTIIMRQQRMLYYIDYNWGDAMFAFI